MRRRHLARLGALVLGLALLAPAAPAAAEVTPAYTPGYYAWAIVRTPDAPAQTITGPDRVNGGGGGVAVTRSARGRWQVRFEGLAGAMGLSPGNFGVALVGPLTSDPTLCEVDEWGADSADTIVLVSCRDRKTGGRVDRPFIVAFTFISPSASVPSGRSAAYGWGDRAFDSGPITGYYTYLPAGGTIGSTRNGTGDYSLLLGDVPAAGGTVVLSDYGNQASCTLGSWYEPDGLAGNTQVNVRCRGLDGAPMDTQVTLLRTIGGGLYPYGSPPTAYVWAEKSKVARYRPTSAYRFNSTGKAIIVSRTGKGVYSVLVKGQTGPGGTLATAYGPAGRACQASSLPSSRRSALVIGVRCFTVGGRPADSRFTLLWTK